MQPISGYRSAYVPLDEPESSGEQAALSLCKSSPPTLTQGFLCDEPTTTSNACRTPSNPVDAYVCDDRKMAGLQATVIDTLKQAAQILFGALVGKAK